MKYRKKIWLLLIIMAFVFILMSVAGNKAEKIKTDNKNSPYHVVKNEQNVQLLSSKTLDDYSGEPFNNYDPSQPLPDPEDWLEIKLN